jgi:hypothetical protein
MNLWRRSRSETTQPATEFNDENNAQPELLLGRFVEQNRDVLRKSSDLWAAVHNQVSGLEGDEVRENLREGIVLAADTDEVELSEGQLQTILNIATKELSTLGFMVARATSSEGILSSSVNSTAKLFADKLHQVPYFMVTRDKGPKKIYVTAIINMQIDIKAADKEANKVLDEFTNDFAPYTETIGVLADLYDGGVGDVDEHYQELRTIIRTDWHAKDPKDSKLRKFVNELQQDPDAFTNEFVKWVGDEQGDRKLTIVQNMARFALAASAITEPSDTVQDVLLRTRTSWAEFQDIDNLFKEFRSQRLAEVKKSFDRISGLPTDSNPRLALSPDEVYKYKTRMGIILGNREQRRNKRQFITKTPEAAPDITQTAPSNERFDRSNKPIYFVKNTGNGFKKEEVNEDTIESNIASMTDKHLVADMLACVQRIHEYPIDTASRFILSGNATVKIDGKPTRLRRFKPLASPNLQVSKDAMGYRVVYGIVDGSVVIVEILNHDQFDRKYK